MNKNKKTLEQMKAEIYEKNGFDYFEHTDKKGGIWNLIEIKDSLHIYFFYRNKTKGWTAYYSIPCWIFHKLEDNYKSKIAKELNRQIDDMYWAENDPATQEFIRKNNLRTAYKKKTEESPF